MFFNVSMKSVVRMCFYLILIGVCITSWIKLLKEQTAFEEKVAYNKTRLPSFTLCPTQPYYDPITNKSIESFEDIKKAIENVRVDYTIEYNEFKPYEKITTVEDKFNGTSYGDWYFVPKMNVFPPFGIAICLIWTPSKEYKLKPDWTFSVSSFCLTLDKKCKYLGHFSINLLTGIFFWLKLFPMNLSILSDAMLKFG